MLVCVLVNCNECFLKSTSVFLSRLRSRSLAITAATVPSTSASASPKAPRDVAFLLAQPAYCLSGWSSAVVCTCEKGM